MTRAAMRFLGVLLIGVQSFWVAKEVHALDLTGTLNATRGEMSQAAEENKQNRKNINAQRKAASEERARTRDQSWDICYQLPTGSDVQTACLGEYPHAISNDNARDLALGRCGGVSGSSFMDDLSYVCSRGVDGCNAIDDNDGAYWCRRCGATNRWLSTYALGTMIQCY